MFPSPRHGYSLSFRPKLWRLVINHFSQLCWIYSHPIQNWKSNFRVKNNSRASVYYWRYSPPVTLSFKSVIFYFWSKCFYLLHVLCDKKNTIWFLIYVDWDAMVCRLFIWIDRTIHKNIFDCCFKKIGALEQWAKSRNRNPSISVVKVKFRRIRWEYFQWYSQAQTENKTECLRLQISMAWIFQFQCIVSACFIVAVVVNVAYFTFICSFEACRARSLVRLNILMLRRLMMNTYEK